MTAWLARLFGKVRVSRSRAGLKPVRGQDSAGF